MAFIKSRMFLETAVFPEIMAISNDLTIVNSISSFVPKYWLIWQILVAILNKFLIDKERTTEDRIPVHSWVILRGDRGEK